MQSIPKKSRLNRFACCALEFCDFLMRAPFHLTCWTFFAVPLSVILLISHVWYSLLRFGVVVFLLLTRSVVLRNMMIKFIIPPKSGQASPQIRKCTTSASSATSNLSQISEWTFYMANRSRARRSLARSEELLFKVSIWLYSYLNGLYFEQTAWVFSVHSILTVVLRSVAQQVASFVFCYCKHALRWNIHFYGE